MELRFTGEIWYWRGPAPFHFVTVPESEAAEIKAVSAAVTYGWGMIPAAVRIGKTTVTTALWPRTVATSCRSRRRCRARKNSNWATTSRLP